MPTTHRLPHATASRSLSSTASSAARQRFALAALGVLCVTASLHASVPSVDEPPTLVVTGRVVDFDDEPIAGARVELVAQDDVTELATPASEAPGSGASELWARPAIHALTDPDGRFVARVHAGVVLWRVTATGFREVGVPGLEVPSSLDQSLDQSLESPVDLGTIRLPPDRPLRGTVLDSAGRPLAGASVRAAWLDASASRGATFGRREADAAATDAEGRFALEGLPRGVRVDLAVEADGFIDARVEAVPVERDEPVRVRLERSLELEVLVVDEGGRGIGGATVELVAAGEASRRATDADGTALFVDLERRDATLVAWTDSARSSRRRVELRDVSEPVALELREAAALRGRVVDPEGVPVDGARVRIAPERAGRVDVAGPTAEREPARQETASSPDGGFTVRPVDPGEHRLTLTHPDFQAVTAGVALEAGVETPVELAFEHRVDRTGLRIRGRVVDLDDRPLAGASLRLVALDGPPSDAPSVGAAQSDLDGRFVVEAPRHGRYVLEARRAGRSSTRSMIVTLDGSEPEPLLLRLPRGGVVEGAVLGVAPGALVRLSIRADAVHAPTARGLVRADGSYRLGPLAPGRWTVHARVDGRAVLEDVTVEDVTLEDVSSDDVFEDGAPEDVTTRLDLRFEPGHAVRGLALRGGEPAAGAAVDLTCGGRSPHADRDHTDAAGAFHFDDVPPSSCALTVSSADGRTRARETFQVVDGTDLVVELAAATLRGRVVAAGEGRPLAGARLELVGAGGAPAPTMITGADGRFAFEVPHDGPFPLRATARGHVTVELAAPAGPDAPPLELALWPVEPVVLHVVDPLEGVPERVTVTAAQAAVGLRLTETHRPALDGRVVLGGLAPGSWRLTVVSDRGAVGRTTVRVPGGPFHLALGTGASPSTP